MKKLLKRINFIDCLLLIIFAAALFFLRDFAAPAVSPKSSGDVLISYTVELFRREDVFINNVKTGEKLYDVERGYEIGVITDVYALPYYEDSPDFENGVIEYAPVEGLSNIYAVAQARAQITDYATNIGQYQLMVGKEAFVRTKSFSAGAYIVKVERLER